MRCTYCGTPLNIDEENCPLCGKFREKHTGLKSSKSANTFTPDATVPETKQPAAAAPETQQPVAAAPAVQQPVAAVPAVQQPVTPPETKKMSVDVNFLSENQKRRNAHSKLGIIIVLILALLIIAGIAFAVKTLLPMLK